MKTGNVPSVAAIVPAAGEGRRIGADIPKAFLNIDGRPILYYTLKKLHDVELVKGIAVVVPSGMVEKCRLDIVNRYKFEKVIQVIEGGATRQDSVYNGLRIVPQGCEIVMIHDGVRPFVRSTRVEDVIKCASTFGGALLAVPARDSLKVINGNAFTIEREIDRSGIWMVQTPQAFACPKFREAHDKALADGFTGTDDSSLMTRLGYVVRVVRGDYDNLKITATEDLELARVILQARGDETSYR